MGGNGLNSYTTADEIRYLESLIAKGRSELLPLYYEASFLGFPKDWGSVNPTKILEFLESQIGVRR